MRIDANRVYEDARYGKALVQGVHQQYATYDTEDGTGVEAGMFVRFAQS